MRISDWSSDVCSSDLLHVSDVGILAGGIDDHEEMIVAVGDHQVVENAAILVGEEAVALAAGLQAEDVDRHERLERTAGVADRAGSGAKDNLAHVGNVEKAGGRACLQMRLEDAGRI